MQTVMSAQVTSERNPTCRTLSLFPMRQILDVKARKQLLDHLNCPLTLTYLQY